MSVQAMKQALEALEHISKAGCDHFNGLCTCEYQEAATALRAAIAEQEKCEPVARVTGYHAPVPAGWQLVPVEPTEAMKVAGSDALGVYHCGSPSDIYKAVLQAAPKPGESHD